jgi:transcription antitermination factor NusG
MPRRGPAGRRTDISAGVACYNRDSKQETLCLQYLSCDAGERIRAVPLLKPGPEVFPRSLFELSDSEMPWLVALTRSRQEKAVARHLEPQRIPFYLPQYTRTVERSGRTRTSFLPLFPGYVFVRAEPTRRLHVLQSPGVVRLLLVKDQWLIASELRELRSFQEAGARIVPIRTFEPGDGVTVVGGPFRGYSGRVARDGAGPRLVVSISMLHQSVSVEFERTSVVSRSDSSVSPARGRAFA